MKLGLLNWWGSLNCPTCDYDLFTAYPTYITQGNYPSNMHGRRGTIKDDKALKMDRDWYERIKKAGGEIYYLPFHSELEYYAYLEIPENEWYCPPSYTLWWGKNQCWECKKWFSVKEFLPPIEEDSTGTCPNPECGASQEEEEEKIYDDRMQQPTPYYEEENINIGRLIQYPLLDEKDIDEWGAGNDFSLWIQGFEYEYKKLWLSRLLKLQQTYPAVFESPVIVIPAAPQHSVYDGEGIFDYISLKLAQMGEVNMKRALKYYWAEWNMGCWAWEHRNHAWKQMCGEDYLENFVLLKGVPQLFGEENKWFEDIKEAGYGETSITDIQRQVIEGGQDYWVCVNSALNDAVYEHIHPRRDMEGRYPFRLSRIAAEIRKKWEEAAS